MEQVSVIVPIYNVEKYLNRCVSSIVQQTYKNLEIILVDDGSPDNCPAMCDTWKEQDSRIKVVHKKNGGLSDARNAGLEVASGDYVAFVDSDDWIEKDYISFLLSALLKTDADVAACEVRIIQENEAVSPIAEDMPDVEVVKPREALDDLLQGKGFRAVAWNKLYRRELIKGEKFAVGKLHEDEFFSYRIYDKAERLTFVGVPLYNYVQRSGSIMTTFSSRHLDVLDAYLQRLELLKKKYPDLYVRDKVSICAACINYYCDIMIHGCADQINAKKQVKKKRRQVKITLQDICHYNWKERIYCVFSHPVIIDLFCKVRILRGYTNE